MFAVIATVMFMFSATWMHEVRADEDVCVDGFVMDKYCIDLGVLLDNSAIETLENPEQHSVHCLVDVSRCYNSGFNILLPNPSGSPAYALALKLDAAGNQMVIDEARRVGKPGAGHCTTCTGNGELKEGFRGTFFGTLVRAADGDVSTLKVKNMTVSPKAFNASAADGCPGSMNLNISLITDAGGFTKPAIAHGSLMIIGWGFLLPTGVASARLLKHRPNALWFRIHRIMQVVGLIVAICGWGVALHTFDVFNNPGNSSYNHGVLGMTVMILGILQPFNALIRPHAPEKGEKRPLKRLIWEIVHKTSGYLAVILAAATICFGTFVIAVHNTEFRAAWGVTLAWLLLFSLSCVFDSYKYKQEQVNSEMGVTYNKDMD